MPLIKFYEHIISRPAGDYKYTEDCGYDPYLFPERLGFFLVATATFPDDTVSEALMKYSRLCAEYSIRKQHGSVTAEQGSLLKDVSGFVASEPAIITPCCGGGKVR